MILKEIVLDERTLLKVTNDKGDVSKEDFVKIALENKLLDFGNAMSGEASRNQKKNMKYTREEFTLFFSIIELTGPFSWWALVPLVH